MNTQDLERAIAQCKTFFISPRTGRAVYEYDDIRAVLKANGVEYIEKLTNGILGRAISRLGGFVLDVSDSGGTRRRTVQAAPERIKQLRAQVAQYVNRPSTRNPNSVKITFGGRSQFSKKARF